MPRQAACVQVPMFTCFWELTWASMVGTTSPGHRMPCCPDLSVVLPFYSYHFLKLPLIFTCSFIRYLSPPLEHQVHKNGYLIFTVSPEPMADLVHSWCSLNICGLHSCVHKCEWVKG